MSKKYRGIWVFGLEYGSNYERSFLFRRARGPFQRGSSIRSGLSGVVIAELPQASTAAQRTAARQRLEVVAAPCADIFRKCLVSNAVVAYVLIIDLACRNIVPGAIRAIGDLPLKIDLHRLPRACTAGNLL
jgi:hypothetical protein